MTLAFDDGPRDIGHVVEFCRRKYRLVSEITREEFLRDPPNERSGVYDERTREFTATQELPEGYAWFYEVEKVNP